jgi:hypothetical protein
MDLKKGDLVVIKKGIDIIGHAAMITDTDNDIEFMHIIQ